MEEKEIKEQEDKQTKKEEIKEEKKEEIKDEKSDLMVIVEAITKGFETLGNKIDALGTKIDTGFNNLGTKIDKGFGELKDVFKKYMSRENEWTSLKLYSDEVKKIIEKELNLTNYRFHYESKENGADFLIKIEDKESDEIKAYIIVEVKDFPSENIIIKAYEQIEKAIKNYIPSEHREEKKEKGEKIIIFNVPVIATILFRFWEEDPSELVETANKVLEKRKEISKEKVNIKFYDFHIGYYYNNDKYQIISLYKKQQEEQGDVEGA